MPIFNERRTLRGFSGACSPSHCPEKMAPKPMDTTGKDAPAALSARTAANPANINPGATSKGSQATNSPAKPRGLSRFPMVTGIQHWSSADSSTVVVNLEDQVQRKAHRLPDPDRTYFDLRDTQLASNLAWKSIEVGDALLKRIRVAQPVGRDAHCAGDEGQGGFLGEPGAESLTG
jgi:N-acetylmuramoyl-L-alanine amidase